MENRVFYFETSTRTGKNGANTTPTLWGRLQNGVDVVAGLYMNSFWEQFGIDSALPLMA